MDNTQVFTPQRYEIGGADVALGMDKLEAYENALRDMEQEIHIETSARRSIAAYLVGIGWRESHQLAEHLAWLLERETDALAAYSLYRAVMATHPENWTITPWIHSVLQTTPFPLLHAVIMQDLFSQGSVDVESAECRALMAQLNPENPEHRAVLAEHLWLMEADSKCNIDDVIGMLSAQACMAEKVAGMRIVQFTSDPQLDERAVPALMDLFKAERHTGLSLKIADVLVRKHGFRIDLDMLAFFIRAWHTDAMAAAKTGMGTMLFGVEGFLMDDFFQGEQRKSALTAALLAEFSPSRLPDHATSIVDALAAISTDLANPFAAFAASAALGEIGHPNAVGKDILLLETAKTGVEPAARALAIRVLGQQRRALLPLLQELKTLCVAPDTDSRVRRAAFHAWVNKESSGLTVKSEEVIDLYFQYLREAPSSHFADALHGSDLERTASYFLTVFAQSIEAMASESARMAAFNLVTNPFGFGISPEFERHWPQVVQLMLTALDLPAHADLHYAIFWNMLYEVAVPKRAADAFGKGLRDRLNRIEYTERSRGQIEDWLQRHEAQ
jgi:hypothetical protein